MKCSLCKKREATIHLTEVINDKVKKLHICEECAQNKSMEMQSHFGLTDLLSGLMDFGPSIPGQGPAADASVKCSGCGMTYPDFQKRGKLGCGKCYDTFAKDLSSLLQKINGSDRHTGKMPFRGRDNLEEQKSVQRLKNELSELVRNEEFEKAALLRDKIRELEEKIDNEDEKNADK
jgi:protein arginine kinase activator